MSECLPRGRVDAAQLGYWAGSRAGLVRRSAPFALDVVAWWDGGARYV